MTDQDDQQGRDFSDLGLSDPILKTVHDVGYETPSAIQAATIPALLEGRDVVGLAQTGTGKTAAFALPILARLDLSPEGAAGAGAGTDPRACAAGLRGLRALRRPPARACTCCRSTGVRRTACNSVRCAAACTSSSAPRAGSWTTCEKGTLDLSELRFLVLDEADEMLKMGFAEDVETILADTPDDKQVALFSATMPAQIRRISKKYLNDPLEITVKNKTTTSANTTQRYLIVSYPQKVDALTRILEVENFEGMIVFVRTKNETETLAEKLRARGFSAMAINGDVAAGAARAHRQPAQVRQARHPGRHRRRCPRPGRRTDQPRRQLRHPDRHRVLRPPHRPHRPGGPQRRGDLLRHAARAPPAEVDREGHPAAA